MAEKYQVEEAIFGTTQNDEIAGHVSRWCSDHLGAPVAEVLFVVSRLSHVRGVVLASGRRIVVKTHPPGAPLDRLRAVFDVQTRLAEQGYPCPQPVHAAAPLCRGLAVAEELSTMADAPDPTDPTVRDAMATGLARQLELTSWLDTPAALASDRPAWIEFRHPGLWAPAHHPNLDFESLGVEAPWIDDVARRAKTLLLGIPGSRLLAGHSDYEAHNVRCTDGQLVAVYDWDSLVAESEEVLVGVAAAVFTAHPDPAIPDAPDPEQRRAFVSAYERARGRSFDSTERERLTAGSAWVTAYNARLHHAFRYGQLDGPGSFAEATRAVATELPG